MQAEVPIVAAPFRDLEAVEGLGGVAVRHVLDLQARQAGGEFATALGKPRFREAEEDQSENRS